MPRPWAGDGGRGAGSGVARILEAGEGGRIGLGYLRAMRGAAWGTGGGSPKRRQEGGAPVFNRGRKKMILWVDLDAKRKEARGLFVNAKFPTVLRLK